MILHNTLAARPGALAWAVLLSCSLPVMDAAAASRTYTLDADFDLGVLVNVNHDAPNNNQLQLNQTGSTFPVLWIANGGEDTLSKFDSQNNKEIARYRTWFGPAGQAGYIPHLNDPFAGPAPSRTAVDQDGNAYVLNRHFDGRPALLIKVLTEGGIDRNGNGVIDTSADLDNSGLIGDAAGEILNMADSNGNGKLDSAEITDERIAWAVEVGPNNGLGRALCIGTDSNLWVGLYNNQQFYKVSSANGSILAGPVSTNPTSGQSNAGSWTPYGCLIDQNGVLWSASLSSTLGKIQNTQSNTGPWAVASFNVGSQNYGIALGNGKVYLGSLNGNRYIQFDPITNTTSIPGQGAGFSSTGISVDGDGNIFTGPYTTGGVTKYAPNGSVLWTASTQFSSETRGVIVDQDNNVWQISRTGSRLMKYRGSDGTPLGVFQIGNHPYTYSDASGLSALNITNPSGTWTVVQDSGGTGTQWNTVSWNANTPTGTGVAVQVRIANTVGDLALQPYQPVSSGTPFNLSGRYIQVQSRLTTNNQQSTPILYDLTIVSTTTGGCDIDGDGDIDRNDVNAIMAARGQRVPPANPVLDTDSDGLITVNDGRACALRCTRPSCATQ